MRILPLLMIAGVAHAQFGDVTVRLFDESGDGGELYEDDLDDFFGLARCVCGHTVRAEIAIGTLAGVDDETPVEIVGGSSCDSDEVQIRDDCVLLASFTMDDFAGATRRDVLFDLSELVVGCGSNREEQGIYALVDEGNDGDFEGVGVQMFPVDTQSPDSPAEGAGISPGDGAVLLSWDEPLGGGVDDEGGYQVFCSRGGVSVFPGRFEPEYRSTFTECSIATGEMTDDPDFLCSGWIAGRSARVAGLQNGSLYSFWVVAIDEHRNVSTALDLGSATPVATEDFYERYLSAGGRASGGFCSMLDPGASPGAGVAPGALFVLFVVLWRLRRRWTLPLIVLLLAGPARAEDDPYASPQSFAAEIKFGPYRPDVDGQFVNGQTPYADVFGTDSSLLTQFEFDWQFLRTPLGSLGVGLLYGFFWESADARVEGTSGAESADKTSLRAHTLGGLAVFRLDALMRYAHIPLVPYGKIGLDYYIWWITEGDGSVANCPEDCPFAVDDPQDIKARGGAWGWQASPGIALLLDVLDPRAARVLDSEMGINHTYAFFELLIADVDNFGGRAGDTLHLGDRTWTAGLAFEF